ncbi:MAG: patatin-like phospholipase family protein [Lachnospiraceae bacterium]|nr:patatin-like phospholipase family protein [Lachnospiraceae bacterium]
MKKYGLCFSGGGGKGAYEIGVWKALKHLGKVFDITAVSGASIGAVNGAFFAMGDYEKAEKVWNNISMADFFDIAADYRLSRDGLNEILNNSIDYEKIKFSPVKLYVNTSAVDESLNFPDLVEEVKPYARAHRDLLDERYYHVNDLGKEKIRQLLLASTALPAVYPAVTIDGEKMVDGGMTDNVPIRPLIEEAECSNLIVVMCGKDNEYDIYLASRCDEIIEIRPSRNIGDLFDGTLDFNPENVSFRVQLGFYDTLRVFDMLERKKMGIPYTAAEKMQSEKRDYDRIMAAVKADKAVNRIESHRSQYDNLLKKYSDKYGIDL